MRSTMWRAASSLALLTLVTAGAAAAQTTYPNVKMSGRLQVEFYDFNNGENAIYAALPAAARAAESNFLIRRARIEAKGNLTENITFIIQPNYTTGQSGRHAEGRVPRRRVHQAGGQERVRPARGAVQAVLRPV